MPSQWKNMEVETGGFLNQSSTYAYDYDYEVNNYDEESAGRAAVTVLIPLLYSVVLVVGLLGNVLLLVALAQRRRSWSVSDIVILHLGVADILLLATLPLWAVQAAGHLGWCFGVTLCKISGAVFDINFYCGIFLLVCISLDCCLSIVHTTQLWFFKRTLFTHVSCLLVWFVSLLLTVPDWLFRAVDEAQINPQCIHNYSQSGTDWKLLSRLLHLTLGTLLPTATLIICCSCILLHLQCSPKTLQKQRAIMVILPLVVVFVLCWMPYNITLILDTLSGKPEGSLKTALMVTPALGCISACLRPVLYLALCANFRKWTLASLRCATVESRSSLWELGVGEEARSHQNHEKEEQMQQMTVVDDQVAVSLVLTSEQKSPPCDSAVV